MTGNVVKTDNVANNQIPFFGSHVRQSTSDTANNSILSNHTGIEEFSKKKSTPIPLFEPSKDIHITYGTQQDNQELVDRITTSKYRKNELPFQKIIKAIKNGIVAAVPNIFYLMKNALL